MKKIFLIIFLLFIICAPNIATAQVKLETALPNIPGDQLPAGKELPSYINYLFIFGLGAITILALAQMMLGGIQYILAAGNVSKTEDAKNTIQQALLGLGLLLASFLLLRTINPDLVNLKNPTLTPLQFENPQTPTPPTVPPQPGRPSELIYSVMLPTACDKNGGQIFSPCKTHCLGTPGLCSASNICCGTKK